MEVADRRSGATKPPAAGVPRKIKEVKIMSSNEMDSKIKELRELLRDALDTMDNIPQKEVCNNA